MSYTYSEEIIPLPVQFIETVDNSREEESERLFLSEILSATMSWRVSTKKIEKLCLAGETVEKHPYLLHFKVRKPNSSISVRFS